MGFLDKNSAPCYNNPILPERSPAMPQTTPKKRLLRAILQVGGLLLLLIGYAVFYNATGLGFPCVIYQTTGLQCAGCGLTRAFSAVLRLDLAASFAYNPIWPLFLGYFSWIGVAGTVAYVRRGEFFFLPGKLWIHITVLSVVSAFGVLRNFF